VATKCSSKLYIINPTVTEAFATYIVVEFDRDLRIQNIILEDDALKIGDALQKEGQSGNRYENLINDLKTMLHIQL
jgi:hypothetical protein